VNCPVLFSPIISVLAPTLVLSLVIDQNIYPKDEYSLYIPVVLLKIKTYLRTSPFFYAALLPEIYFTITV
jgi:hypothetical protein